MCVIPAFHAIFRCGEVLAAKRSPLISQLYLQREPSSAQSALDHWHVAKLQHNKSDHWAVYALWQQLFKDIAGQDPFWPASAARYRACWNAVLKVLDIPYPDASEVTLDSRGGGSTAKFWPRMTLNKFANNSGA